jgi:hypothetical protein
MSMLGPAMSAGSSILNAYGSIRSGNATAAAENVNAQNTYQTAAYQAAQLKLQGDTDLAASQRTMQ